MSAAFSVFAFRTPVITPSTAALSTRAFDGATSTQLLPSPRAKTSLSGVWPGNSISSEVTSSALTFAVSADSISLPESRYWTIGQDITAIVLEGVLNGPMTNEPGLAAQARFWRDGGGSLDVSRLTIDWGATRLDATATLALDDDLQPMGAGTGKLVGYGVALDALAANGVFGHAAVQAAKAMLSLLASTSAEGKPEVVDVPLSLQFRTLSVHQVPLVRFPELEWPGR